MPAEKKKNKTFISPGKPYRKSQFCPKCGPGVHLANHNNRLSCGKCGYTEFKR